METCEHSTGSLFEDANFSLAGSRVKMSPGHTQAMELEELAADYGWNSIGSLARFDPDTSLWKTSKACLTGAFQEWPETWHVSGMTRNGILYPLAPWVHHTHVKECSLWPTPAVWNATGGMQWGTAQHILETGDWHRPSGARIGSFLNLAVPLAELKEGRGKQRGKVNPRFEEWLMGYPDNWTEVDPSEAP